MAIPTAQIGLGIFSYGQVFGRNPQSDVRCHRGLAVGGRDTTSLGAVRGTQDYAVCDFSTVGLSVPCPNCSTAPFRPDFPSWKSLSIDSTREAIYGLVRFNPAENLKVMLGRCSACASERILWGRRISMEIAFVGATLEWTLRFQPMRAMRQSSIHRPIDADNLLPTL